MLRKYELVSFIGLILLLLHVAVPAARAADVTLSWDRNSESTVVGYKLHYGNASRTYQTALSCGNNTTYTVTGLGAGTYYFALTASNSAGQESGYSNEVSKTIAAAGCTYTVAPTNRSLLSTAQPASFTVTTGSTCAWTAGTNASWMTRTSAGSITGSGTASFSVAANTGSASRTGTVTVAGQTVTVAQAGTGCGLAVSPTSRKFDANGATGSVWIVGGSSCSWTASSSASWITVSSAKSGTGNATVTYTVAKNTSSSGRTGKITLAGQTFWAIQSGTGCVYSISPTSKNFAGAGGQGSVALTGPSGCGWTASSTETWITISSSNSGSGNATVGYSVQSNTASSSRTGMLIIGGRILTVNQAANNQTFFPQFSAGAQWESELVLTNPSSSETATGSVTVLNDGGEQIGDSGSRSFTIEPLGSARFAMDGSGDLVSGSARVKANIPVAGVAKYRHPALGMAVVGNSAPARSVMAAVVRDKDRGLNTGIAVSNALDRAVEVKLSLRGHDGREAAGGSASYTLPASGHVAKLMDQWFPEAETSGFQGTVVVSTEQTEESITAAAMQIGTSVGELTSLPVVAVDPARAGRELYFAHFAKGTGWDTALFLTNPTGSMTASEVVFYDDAGNLIAPSANGQMSAGALASLQPQGGAVIAADGSGELLSGSARVVADNALGGFLRFSAPGLGMAGAEASEPMEGFIAPMSRHAGQSTSTGVAIASIGNPVALSLTLRDENGKPVVGGEAVLELRANGHVSRLLEQLFPEADTHNFKGTLTVKAAGGKIVGTVIEIGLQPGQFTALPVAELR